MVRLAFSLVAIFFLPGAIHAAWWGLMQLFLMEHVWPPILWGISGGGVLYFFALSRSRMLVTFEHELTHAIVAKVFLRRVDAFVVTSDRGGSVSHSGGFGGRIADDIIGLAPYFLPTLTFLSVLFKPFVSHGTLFALLAWIGATLSYHILSGIREIRLAWTKRRCHSSGSGGWVMSDIGRRGYLYSTLFIAVASLAVHGIIFSILAWDYPGIKDWARTVWQGSVDAYCVVGHNGLSLFRRVFS